MKKLIFISLVVLVIGVIALADGFANRYNSIFNNSDYTEVQRRGYGPHHGRGGYYRQGRGGGCDGQGYMRRGRGYQRDNQQDRNNNKDSNKDKN